MYKTLDQAFQAAFLLTGSSEVAENSVLDGIAALEFGHVTDRILIFESVKAAIRRRRSFSGQPGQAIARSLSSFDGCFHSHRFLETVLYCESFLEYLLRRASQFCV